MSNIVNFVKSNNQINTTNENLLTIVTMSNPTGPTGSNMYLSTDGWNTKTNLGTPAFAQSCNNLYYNGVLWVGVGSNTGNIGSTGHVAYSSDAFHWTLPGTVFSGPTGTQGSAVIYYNNNWFIGGGTRQTGSATGVAYNIAYYSPDAIIWTPLYGSTGAGAFGNISPTGALNQNVYSFTTNGNIIVAGGDCTNLSTTSCLAYSYSGFVWESTTAIGTSIKGLACNGTIFVAVHSGGSNNVSYSIDGINWISSTTNIASTLTWVSWTKDRFLIGGSTNGTIYYSFDGNNWITNSLALVNTNGSTYNGSYYLLTASTGGTPVLYRSLDSINWSIAIGGTTGFGGYSTGLSTPSIFTQSLTSLVNTNGWITSGHEMGLTYNTTTSLTGGYNMTLRNNGVNTIVVDKNGCSTIQIDEQYGTFISSPITLIGIQSTNALYYTMDNKSLVNINGIFSTFTTKALGWNKNIWLASDDSSVLYYSFDGLNWTITDSIFGHVYVDCVKWNGKMWVGGSQHIISNTSMYYSYDGMIWTPILNTSTLFNSGCQTIEWNGKLWLAGGSVTIAGNGNTLAYSYDGINWIGIGSTVFGATCNSIVWNGSLWVAVGTGTNAIASCTSDPTNPNNWLTLSFGSSTYQPVSNSCMTWNGKRFVTVGIQSFFGMTIIAHSTSGLAILSDWTFLNSSTIFTNSGNRCTWNGSIWILTGTGTNSVITSPDNQGATTTWIPSFTLYPTSNFGGNGLACYGGFWNWSGSASYPSINFSTYGQNIGGIYSASENSIDIAVKDQNVLSVTNNGIYAQQLYLGGNSITNSTGSNLNGQILNVDSSIVYSSAPNNNNNVSFITFQQSALYSATGTQTVTNASTLYIANAPTGGTGTSGNIMTITNPYAINVSSGTVLINTTTNSSSSNTGAILLSGGISISNTTDASSATGGGTFTTLGGVGIAKSLYVGTNTTLNNPTGIFTSSSTNPSYIIGGGSNPTGAFLLSGGISISNTTDTISATGGGTFTTLGGVGIGESLYVGKNITMSNFTGIFTSSSTNPSYIIGGGSNPTGAFLLSGGISISNTTDVISATGGGTFTTSGGFSIAKTLCIGSTASSSSSSTGAIILAGGISISNATDTTSSTGGGSFTTLGGIGIGKNVYIGESLRRGIVDTNFNAVTLSTGSVAFSTSFTSPNGDELLYFENGTSYGSALFLVGKDAGVNYRLTIIPGGNCSVNSSSNIFQTGGNATIPITVGGVTSGTQNLNFGWTSGTATASLRTSTGSISTFSVKRGLRGFNLT
jgi:hypothetical protein